MVLLTGLAIGAILFLLGLGFVLRAPRIGPSHTLRLRSDSGDRALDIWRRANKAGGRALMIGGVLFILPTLALDWLSMEDAQAISLLIGLLLLFLLGTALWTVAYARSMEASPTYASRRARVPFRWVYVAPSAALCVLCLGLGILFWQELPPGLMATHFNLVGDPTDFMTRNQMLAVAAGTSLLLLLINVVICVAMRAAPRALSPNVDQSRFLTFVSVTVAFGQGMIFYALLDTLWYGLYRVHLLPVWLPALVAVATALLLFGAFTASLRRHARQP